MFKPKLTIDYATIVRLGRVRHLRVRLAERDGWEHHELERRLWELERELKDVTES